MPCDMCYSRLAFPLGATSTTARHPLSGPIPVLVHLRPVDRAAAAVGALDEARVEKDLRNPRSSGAAQRLNGRAAKPLTRTGTRARGVWPGHLVVDEISEEEGDLHGAHEREQWKAVEGQWKADGRSWQVQAECDLHGALVAAWPRAMVRRRGECHAAPLRWRQAAWAGGGGRRWR